MVRKETLGRHELAELVKELRDEARMSREQLAQAGGLSVGPIKRIESEGHVPKAQTLQQIADGLATYAPGRRDEELAGSYYERLMRAAGYLEEKRPATVEVPMRPRPVEDLTDEEVVEALTRISGDPKFSADFLSVADNWEDMDPEARRFVLSGFEAAMKYDAAIKAARARDEDRSRRPRS